MSAENTDNNSGTTAARLAEYQARMSVVEARTAARDAAWTLSGYGVGESQATRAIRDLQDRGIELSTQTLAAAARTVLDAKGRTERAREAREALAREGRER
jgi:hypothetical protein